MSQIFRQTGQWIGKEVKGGAPGLLLVNIERRSPDHALSLWVDERTGLRLMNEGAITRNGNKFTARTSNYRVYDPGTDSFMPLAEFYTRNNINEKVPTEAQLWGEVTGDGRVIGHAKTDLGKENDFELCESFSKALLGEDAPPEKPIRPMTWSQFKDHVARYQSRGVVLFRGEHSAKFRLQTLFHRRERNNLVRYLEEDVVRLRHHINSIGQHYYHPGGEDLLGLLSLAQHHGFPTPLLDWTESPYVAAFFAFDCLNEGVNCKDEEAVRIVVFNLEKWKKSPRRWANSLKDPWPDLQFLRPPAHNNARYYPQQAMAAFSNVDDIEGFVRAHELKDQQTYLSRIPILRSEQRKVECELRFMGITAATLFPGLEGACKALRAELFNCE